MYGMLMLIALEFVKESIFIVKRMFEGKKSKCISLSPQICYFVVEEFQQNSFGCCGRFMYMKFSQ